MTRLFKIAGERFVGWRRGPVALMYALPPLGCLAVVVFPIAVGVVCAWLFR